MSIENKESIQLSAYAKINLGLDVIRRLENGYHEVRMIMQTVDICDSLTLRKTESGIRLTVEGSGVPADENNLVCKAARLMFETYGIRGGVDMTLVKRIPVAAGMAGGSADAAAAFRGIGKLFGLSVSEEELKRLGVQIGADIPYCITGGTALSEGIGEILTPLPAPPDCFVLVAKPDIFVSTAFVYQNLHADRLQSHPDIDGMIEAIRQKNLYGIAQRMENVLETVTVKKYPVIDEIKQNMKENGALNALMSGSGPTVFGIFEKKETAEAACEVLKQTRLAKQLYCTRWHIPDSRKEQVYE